MNKRDFTLNDLLTIFKKRWIILLVCALLVGACFGFYSHKTYIPEYTSEVTFYVSPSSEMGNWDSSDDTAKVNWALKIINTYMGIIKVTDFSDKLNDSYKEEYEAEYKKCGFDKRLVRESVSMSIISEEATLFKVKVKTPYSDASYHIAEKVEELVPSFIEGVTQTSKTVHVADMAKPPVGLSNSDNMARNTAIGFMLGALLAFLVLFLIEVFDVRIMSEEDIVDNYTTPLLGTIPLFQSDNRSKRGNR
ncbi:MAG: hypothetical protein IJC50_08275 [Clostridia bacterium]|nr:hypothetical protein [Clostridia bacterium]